MYTCVALLLIGITFYLLHFIKKVRSDLSLLLDDVWYICFVQHPQTARKLLVSMLKEEMRIALAICLELCDIIFDSIVFANMLKAGEEEVTNTLRLTWIIFFGIACALSLANLLIKGKLLVECLRHRDQEQEVEADSPIAKHRERLHTTSRKIKGLLAGMMIGLGESLPMGIRNSRVEILKSMIACQHQVHSSLSKPIMPAANWN